MKILLVAYAPPGSRSGIPTVYMNLKRGFEALGINVELITRESCSLQAAFAGRIVRRIFGAFGPVMRLLGGEVETYLLMRSGCARNLREYDIVHAQDVMSALAAQRIYKSRVPVVLSCHFNDHPATEMLKQHGLAERNGQLLYSFFKRCFSKIEYCLCISEYVSRRVRPLLLKDAVIDIVRNGVDFDAMSAVEPEGNLTERFHGKKVIMNVGRLETRKNQRFLLDVLSYLEEDAMLCLLGDGPDREVLERDAKTLGVDRRVYFAGHRNDVVACLKTATLYLHAARNENCPMALLEAIGSGVPVMAPSAGGMPEILASSQETSLYGLDCDAAVLAERMRDLFSDADALNRLAVEQQRYVLAEFCLESMVRRTLDFYTLCRRSTESG